MKRTIFLLLLLALASLGTVLAQTSVFFEIRNERTETHPTLGNSHAFDLYMNASANGTFHSRGQIYFSYNINRFGTSAFANNRVAYEHADLLEGDLTFLGTTTPLYNTINVIDNGNDKLAFTWQSNFLNFMPNAMVHNEVPDSATHIYTIYMQIVHVNAAANLAYDYDLMRGQQFYLEDTNGDGTPEEVPYVDGFLPVELLSFKAEKLGENDAILTWETSKELNNDKFVIEKRKNAGEFEAIGEVKGVGTSDELQRYTFTDKTGLAEQNYYRLRQVDLDGSVTYSQVAEIGFDPYANDRFLVYPSPATDHTFLKAVSDLDGDYRVTVIDLSGKVAREMVMSKSTPSSGMRIDLSGLTDGMYFVRTISPLGQAFVNRLVKVEHN